MILILMNQFYLNYPMQMSEIHNIIV